MISRGALEDDVYEAILEKLLNGHYEMGQRIDINELKEEFEVSSTPVLIALRRLVYGGMLTDSIRNKGYRVPVYTHEDFIETQVALNIMILVAFERICLMEDIDSLLEHFEKLCADTLEARDSGDYKRYMQEDEIFHNEVVRCLNNSLMLKMHRDLRNQCNCMLRYYSPEFIKSTNLVGSELHVVFCECLRTRNHSKIYKLIMKLNSETDKALDKAVDKNWSEASEAVKIM